jgi:hypothetical protein
MKVSSLAATDSFSSLGLQYLSSLSLNLEVSLPHEGEHGVRPYENPGIGSTISMFTNNPTPIFSRMRVRRCSHEV